MLKSVIVSTLLTTLSHVALALPTDLGYKVTTFKSPQGLTERCHITMHIPGVKYAKKAVKKEAELCELDFYAGEGTTPVGFCPKITSTSPGTNIFKNEDKLNPDQFMAKYCVNTVKPDLKSYTKFKQTTGITVNSSPVVYYHLSNFLGGAGRVPPAVFRTFDKKEHLKVTELAQKNIQNMQANYPAYKVKFQENLVAGWQVMKAAHKNPKSYPAMFNEDFTQLVGNLIVKVKDSEVYNAMEAKQAWSTNGNQGVFKMLADSRSVNDILGSKVDATTASKNLVLMKDASDMLVMDYMMSQYDRYGNAHYRNAYYWFENGEIEIETVDRIILADGKEVPEPTQQELMKKKNAFVVRELYLIDNDAGIRFGNLTKSSKALDYMAHMSPLTYSKVQAWAQKINDPQFLSFIKAEYNLVDKELDSIKRNSLEAAQILRNRCLGGQLKLDADVNTYFKTTKAVAASCQ